MCESVKVFFVFRVVNLVAYSIHVLLILVFFDVNKYCDNCNTVISTVIEVIYGFFGRALIFFFFHVDIFQ